MRTTSRRYNRPRRPLPLRLLNAGWRALGTWTQPAIDAKAWFRAAGAPSHWDREPFDVLAQSIHDEARLSPLGRMITQSRIVGALRARKNLEALGEPPSRAGAPPPIVIVGLQRTGTTLLQRLLAAVPGYRGLTSWEALNPAPWPGERTPRARQRFAHRAAGAVRYLAPDFVAAHPIEPDQPEEEVVLFEQVGLTTSFEGTMRVPTFAAWLEDQDQSPAYAWMRRILAHLEPDPALRWVLKTPHHLEWLPDLTTALPTARLVWTHREPEATLPSFCSMVAHAFGMCSDQVDPHEIGAHWLRKTVRMVRRAQAFREDHPHWPILDVDYHDLIANPHACIAEIVTFAGGTYDDDAHAAVTEQLDRTVRHKYGQHVYEAADFGLDAATMANAYPPSVA
ncbi:MAG: sulfotransferase [Myxococcota bacterium]